MNYYGLSEQATLSEQVNLNRELIARIFLHGEGIEIGALHSPLQVPMTAKVKYVDRMHVSDLRQQYPELASSPLVDVDIVADGERLETIQDATQDFVIANHFLEHCQDPIKAIVNMLRVLRPGGVLYLAVPDKRHTFDVDRPVTSLEHLMKDYSEGPEWSREQHFAEWVKFVHKIGDETAAEVEVARLMNLDYSIHFHVWTPDDLMQLFSALKERLNLGFEVELFFQHGRNESITIIRKVCANGESSSNGCHLG